MKKLNIDIDYKRPAPKNGGEHQLSNSELSYEYVLMAGSRKYPQGAPDVVRRAYARLQNKMEAAIAAKQPIVELEDGEFDVLKKCFDNVELDIALSKYIDLFEDEIDRVARAKPDAGV